MLQSALWNMMHWELKCNTACSKECKQIVLWRWNEFYLWIHLFGVYDVFYLCHIVNNYLKALKMIWMMGQNPALFSKGWRYHVEVILLLQSFAVERIGEHLQIPDACRQFQQGLCNVCDTSIVQLKREVTAMVQSIHQAQTESPVQSGHVITQQPSNRWVHRWNPHGQGHIYPLQ